MGDSARELTDRFHPLGLSQLCLERFLVSDVTGVDNNPFDAPHIPEVFCRQMQRSPTPVCMSNPDLIRSKNARLLRYLLH